jgi:hypothetical protein
MTGLTGKEGGELSEIMDGGLILRGGALTLPEEHPDGALSRRDGALSRRDGALSRHDGALSRLAKCVAAFVDLVPRRKKSVDILVKSEGTPTLSPIILLILLILSKPFLPIL